MKLTYTQRGVLKPELDLLLWKFREHTKFINKEFSKFNYNDKETMEDDDKRIKELKELLK